MPETPRSTETPVAAPRQALLLQRLNGLKAEISEVVRGIIEAKGTVVQFHLPAVENELDWTDEELELARRALLGKYKSLGINFVVQRAEPLDMEAMMAEMMKDDVPASGTASTMSALADTNPAIPVTPEPETGKKKPVDTAAAAAELLRKMRHRPT